MVVASAADGGCGVRDAFLDVRLELDLVSLQAEADPSAFIIETARSEADRLCERSRAQLRTDRDPELVVEQGQHRLTGQSVLLVASRWAVRVPEGVEMGAPA